MAKTREFKWTPTQVQKKFRATYPDWEGEHGRNEIRNVARFLIDEGEIEPKSTLGEAVELCYVHVACF